MHTKTFGTYAHSRFSAEPLGILFFGALAGSGFGACASAFRAGHVHLSDFQAALIGKITAFEKGQCITGTIDYYTRWLEALEEILMQKSMLMSDRLSFLERDVIG